MASRESLSASHARQQSTASSMQSPSQSSFPRSPSSGTFGSRDPSINEENKSNKSLTSAARSLTATDRKQAFASINAATAAAQKWGWGVLNRNKQREAEMANKDRALTTPMGRGRPLPPPGTPLPPPERTPTRTVPFTLPKRKPVPPPLLPKRPEANTDDHHNENIQSSPKPALPERKNRQSSFKGSDEHADEVLVVEAPLESAPTTPVIDEQRDEFFGHEEAESSMGAWESSVLPDEEAEPAHSLVSETTENKEAAPEISR